jgi:hypothetical protein
MPAERVTQPDGLADDRSGEPVAVVRVGCPLHVPSLTGLPPGRQTQPP